MIVNTMGTNTNNQHITCIVDCNDKTFDDYNAIKEKNKYINIDSKELR